MALHSWTAARHWRAAFAFWTLVVLVYSAGTDWGQALTWQESALRALAAWCALGRPRAAHRAGGSAAARYRATRSCHGCCCAPAAQPRSSPPFRYLFLGASKLLRAPLDGVRAEAALRHHGPPPCRRVRLAAVLGDRRRLCRLGVSGPAARSQGAHRGARAAARRLADRDAAVAAPAALSLQRAQRHLGARRGRAAHGALDARAARRSFAALTRSCRRAGDPAPAGAGLHRSLYEAAEDPL